jgi:DNA relaxase NicK
MGIHSMAVIWYSGLRGLMMIDDHPPICPGHGIYACLGQKNKGVPDRKFPKMEGYPQIIQNWTVFVLKAMVLGILHLYIYIHCIYEILYIYRYLPIVNVVYEPTNITGRLWGTTLCLSAVQGSACARAASTLRLRCSQDPESPPGTRPGPT